MHVRVNNTYLRVAMSDVGRSVDTIEVFISRFVVQVLFAAPCQSDRTFLHIGLKQELCFLLEPSGREIDRGGR